MNELKIHVLKGGAMPRRHSHKAVGYDVYTRAIVWPRMCPVTKHMRHTKLNLHPPGLSEYKLMPGDIVCIGVGFTLELPDGMAGYLEPRGSTAQAEVFVLNSNVPIDPDFRGEPFALLRNMGSAPFSITHGKRIVQLVLRPFLTPKFVRVREHHHLSRTLRGNGSLGSTGTH